MADTVLEVRKPRSKKSIHHSAKKTARISLGGYNRKAI